MSRRTPEDLKNLEAEFIGFERKESISMLGIGLASVYRLLEANR